MDGVLDVVPGSAHDRLELRPVGLGSLERAADELERERDRLVDELDGLEHAVGEAELDRILRPQQAVLAQRVLDDQLNRRLRADQAAASPAVPAHAGKRPRNTSGKPRCRTVLAIVRAEQWSASSSPPPRQAPLIAATVGNGSRAIRAKSTWPARLPSAAISGEIAGNSSMSAPAQNQNGLPVKTAATQSPPSSSGSSRSARRERGPAERGRFRPVLAVVDRDEREWPGRGVHRAQVEDGVRHLRAPRRSRRPCRGRCRGRSGRSAPSAARGTLYASCATSRTPVAASGWPQAIAPP